MTRTAIFGGTFDPPHNGHIGMAKSILLCGAADRILFLPAYRPPHKDFSPCLTPFEDRFAMLDAAIRGNGAMQCSDFEAHRTEKSYTYDTLTMLSGQNPDMELSWIIGSDSLLQLHTWYRAQELGEQYRFITFLRPDCDVTLVYLLQYWPEPVAKRLYASILRGTPEYGIASSQVRSMLRAGEDVSGLVPATVLDYIVNHNLYRK